MKFIAAAEMKFVYSGNWEVSHVLQILKNKPTTDRLKCKYLQGCPRRWQQAVLRQYLEKTEDLGPWPLHCWERWQLCFQLTWPPRTGRRGVMTGLQTHLFSPQKLCSSHRKHFLSHFMSSTFFWCLKSVHLTMIHVIHVRIKTNQGSMFTTCQCKVQESVTFPTEPWK